MKEAMAGIWENIIEALVEIRTHKMRSFLTMLGVIIGIAAIIAIVSTIKGTNEKIMENLVGKGNNNVKITLMQGEEPYDLSYGGGTPNGVVAITDEQKKQIRELDHVVDATFFNSRTYSEGISWGQRLLSGAKVYGVDLHFMDTYGYEVYRGRSFIESDVKLRRKVVLLDQAAAEILFDDENPVGHTIEIKGEPYIVIGLFQQDQTFMPEIESLSDYETYFQETYGMVLMPQICWPIVYSFDEPENAYVRADSTEYMSEIGKKAQDIMRQSITKDAGDLTYAAEDMLEEAKNQQELQSSTSSLLIWVASIALLVGGIGVMNIMLVSVTERTREIGLKRSLGAKRRRIMFQFLTEAAVLTSLGGILGVGVGIVLSQVISKITGIATSISIPSILISVIFSMVIGILFGLLPSFKAANLSPIEALRRE